MLSFIERLNRRGLQVKKSLRNNGLLETLKLTLRFLFRSVYIMPYLFYLQNISRQPEIRKEINYPGTDVSVELFLDVDDIGLSRQLLLHGAREHGVTNLIASEAFRGMSALDIGANIGYFALLEAEVAGPSGTVHAIEPVERNYELLERNIEISNIDNINTYDVAISDASKTMSMTLTQASNLGTLTDMENSEHVSSFARSYWETISTETIELETISVDEFVQRHDIGDVDFIRMDLEGHEVEVIEGMQRTLRDVSAPCNLFIEFHSSLFKTPRDVLKDITDQLDGAGFDDRTVIFEDQILCDVGLEEFINVLASHDNDDPNVLLQKTKTTETA